MEALKVKKVPRFDRRTRTKSSSGSIETKRTKMKSESPSGICLHGRVRMPMQLVAYESALHVFML